MQRCSISWKQNTRLRRTLIAAAAVLAYHNISGVPDIDDLHRGAFQGASVDARVRLLDRGRSPFGFTVAIEPHWNRIDDVTGERVQNHGGTVTLAFDKEVVARRQYAASMYSTSRR